jgi:hypothetical protein
MSDISLILTKAKEKDGSKKQTGIIVSITVRKSRYMKENKTVKILISFSRGMYRFSDLVNKAKELELFKKDGNSYLMPPDYVKAEKITMKEVREHASKYLIDDTLKLLRDAIKIDFGFGIEDGKFEFFDDLQEGDDDVGDDDEDAIDELLEGFIETPVLEKAATDTSEKTE